MSALTRVCVPSAAVALILLVQAGCRPNFADSPGMLKHGINYMQPIKWRLTYTYRVPLIVPSIPIAQRPSEFDPRYDSVGQGTYEVWFVGPREGEEVRGVELVYARPEPTAVVPGRDTDVQFVYYDFAPDGCLPEEIYASIQWEFTTFEIFAYTKDIPREPYDKSSELYKQYTVEEPPISYHPELLKAAKKCVADDGDYVYTALNCYNYMLGHFDYDFSQDYFIAYSGGAAMHDARLTWTNKTGQCDEFANTYCAMLRSLGIPARPVAGLAHGFDLSAGGHAWVEFYMPNVGWIPVDPTYGQDMATVDIRFSIMGAAAELTYADYYFGRHDAYRIIEFKDWNYKLQPPPKTPGAKDTETWFVNYTDRYSGVQEMVHGWPGIPGMGGCCGPGWHRSEEYAGFNCVPDLEMLGPPSDAELKEMIEQIEAEGFHYARIMPAPWNYPIVTMSSKLEDPSS